MPTTRSRDRRLPVFRPAFAIALAASLISIGTRIGATAAPAPGGKATVATVAGTGQKGRSGDGGPADRAALNGPTGLVRGPDKALYVCDTENNQVRRIAPDGTITAAAGTGTKGYAGDGGPADRARLNEPYEVRFDPAGNMVFVERMNHAVRRVDAKTGVITTIAGAGRPGFSGDGGPAVGAEMNQPHSITFDRDGNLYICDVSNHRVRRVDAKTGVITTFAGTGERAPTPDGAKFAAAPLHGPRAIDVDKDGNLWLALREGNAVYKLDVAAGTLRRVAGTGKARTGKAGPTGNDGPARDATLSGPKGLSVGPDGNVYLADTEGHTVRVIDVAAGTIRLVAGTGKAGDGPDGDPGGCAMNRPHGVFADADGSILIGDTENHRVRVVRPAAAK